MLNYIKYILAGTLFLSIFIPLYQNTWGKASNAIIIQRAILEGNNIRSFFQNTGIFNNDSRTSNTPGFEWPKGSGKFAMYSTGLSIGAWLNNNLAMVNASYSGEYTPGIIENGVPVTGDKFRVYKISRSDNCNTNPDYADWKFMIPYGAPYDDINKNGRYDDCIDKPGIKDAEQTIFVCLTDGFAENRNPGEGIGGGVKNPLLYADIRLTAWCYDFEAAIRNMQFIKYEIINQGSVKWDSTYFSIFADPDLGDGFDDRIGCDTLLDLSYCYNGDNEDGEGSGPSYGVSPPAVGMVLLRSAVSKNTSRFDTLGMTSFVPLSSTFGSFVCEGMPNSEPFGTYNYMSGLKKDRSPWINPYITSGSQKTKFPFSGAPYQDSVVGNCNGDSTGPSFILPPGDRRYLMNTGGKNFTVQPGDTQKIVLAQVIERGSDNINSIVKLKQRVQLARLMYDKIAEDNSPIVSHSPALPVRYKLMQNYPNPFNPVTTIEFDIIIRFDVELSVYDLMGKEVSRIVDRELEPGSYKVNFDASGLASGIYYYKIKSGYFEETKKMVVLR